MKALKLRMLKINSNISMRVNMIVWKKINVDFFNNFKY